MDVWQCCARFFEEDLFLLFLFHMVCVDYNQMLLIGEFKL